MQNPSPTPGWFSLSLFLPDMGPSLPLSTCFRLEHLPAFLPMGTSPLTICFKGLGSAPGS